MEKGTDHTRAGKSGDLTIQTFKGEQDPAETRLLLLASAVL